MRHRMLFLAALVVGLVSAPFAVVAAQDVPADVPGLLVALIAIFVPSIATFLALQVLKLTSIINGLSDGVKISLATIFAFVATALTNATGYALPLDMPGLDAGAIAGILNTAGALTVYRLWKLTPWSK